MAKPSIDPQRWSPPRAPQLAGVFAPNDALSDPELIPLPGAGPEDVVVDADGDLYTGLGDGRVLRVDRRTHRPQQLTNTGGRVLGLELLPDGRLLLCDADRGLLAIRTDGEGEPEVLLDTVEGRRLVLTNNATVTSDGVILFTESSARWPLAQFRADVFEHRRSGSLFRFDPASGDVDRLVSGLAFANGVTSTPDGDAVLVAETAGYAIHRVELSGPAPGRSSAFATNLPGFPDNLSTGASGTIWCAVPSPRNPAIDALLPRGPRLRRAVWALPESLQPDAIRTAFVLGFSADGDVTHNLQGDGERFHYVTGVREHDGHLYLGSLVEKAVARVPLPG